MTARGPMVEYTYSCPDCGTELSEDDEVCPSCGTSFIMEGDDTECPVCGSIISASAEVCPHCGTVFEIVYEDEEEGEEDEPEAEDESAPAPARGLEEIDDDMDLDAEIARIEQEELLEEERRRQEDDLARSMSQDQVDMLFWEAMEGRGDITQMPQGDEDLAKILDRMAPLLEATDRLGIDAYTVSRLRDRTYMALHQGDRDGAYRNADQALRLIEAYVEDTLFYEQHFLGGIVEKRAGPEREELSRLLGEMVALREERRLAEALEKLDEFRASIEDAEPGLRRASQAFRSLTRAIAVAERFLIDNRAARSIINQTSDLMSKGRWGSIAELCEAALEKLMHTMRDRASQEFQRIRSETAIAKRRGESGDDFLLSAAAEAEVMLATGQYVQALDRMSRYREEYRRPSA